MPRKTAAHVGNPLVSSRTVSRIVPTLRLCDKTVTFSTSDTNSVGIGLAMAKQIIQSHDGMVEAASEVGKGTTFTVKLFS